MGPAGVFCVRSLRLRCCFVSLAIASPAFWGDLKEGITSSLADTCGSHKTAKRQDRPSMQHSDFAPLITFKRPRNIRPTGVDLVSGVASLGPHPAIGQSRSSPPGYNWTTLQACYDSDKNPDLNFCKTMVNKRAVSQTRETLANIVPAFNELNADQILENQKTLPQCPDELSALREFLGLSPDKREPAQSAHSEDENRPCNQLVSHNQDSTHIARTSPQDDPVIDMITQHELDPYPKYPPQPQELQGDHQGGLYSNEYQEVPGRTDCQHEDVLHPIYRSDPSYTTSGYYPANFQLGIHENNIPAISGKKCLLDLELPKEQAYGVFRAPLAHVSNENLHNYTKRYKEAIDSMQLEAEKQSFTTQWIVFRGLLAAEVRDLNDSENCKRVIRVLESNNSLQSPSKVVELMRQLLMWLIFNYDTFLVRIQPITRRIPHQNDLLDWLSKEFFNPDDSLPVIGEVERGDFAYDEGAFGPVQRWIIRYLSSDSCVYVAFTTSAAILGIWYKNFHMDMWKSHFKNDDEFWSSVNSASDCSRRGDMKFHEFSYNRSDVKHKYIGNFQIHDLRVLEPTLSPLLCKANLPTTVINNTYKLEKNLIHQLTQFHQGIKVVPKCKKIQFKSLSMAFIEPNARQYQDMRYHYIRLVDIFGYIILPQSLKSRLLCLLEKLNHYHAAFLLFLMQKKISVNIDSHIKLLYWIQGAIFNPRVGLPIFGKVESKVLLKDKSKIFTGDLQKFLIEFFTNSASNFEWNQTALSILGYWYKNECRQIWDDNFTDDFLYWFTIAEALSWGFNITQPLHVQAPDK